jgi:hypothetical protein
MMNCNCSDHSQSGVTKSRVDMLNRVGSHGHNQDQYLREEREKWIHLCQVEILMNPVVSLFESCCLSLVCTMCIK